MIKSSHPLPPVQSAAGSRLSLDLSPIEADCSPVVIRRRSFAKKHSPDLASPEERQKTPSRPPSFSLDLDKERQDEEEKDDDVHVEEVIKADNNNNNKSVENSQEISQAKKKVNLRTRALQAAARFSRPAPIKPANLYNMSSSVMTLPSHMAGFLHEIGPASSGVYSFVSYPAALLPNRPNMNGYRNGANDSQNGSVNIMHDRRVIRGNTYAPHNRVPINVNPNDDNNRLFRQRQTERKKYVQKRQVLPNIAKGGTSASSQLFKADFEEARRREGGGLNNGFVSNEAKYTAARARVHKRLAHYQKQQQRDLMCQSPAPVEGRKHTNLQTDQWLEEIKDRKPEVDAAVQTDPTNDANNNDDDNVPGSPNRKAFRTPTPTSDKATQILPDDPDLFAFDDEVGIVLEALVGRTLEQSLLEVIGEEEEEHSSRLSRRK